MKGFSLIELMVVIAIVGTLSVVAIPAYSDYKTRANYARVHSILVGLSQTKAAEYYDINGEFPGLTDVDHLQSIASDTAGFDSDLIDLIVASQLRSCSTGDAESFHVSYEMTAPSSTDLDSYWLDYYLIKRPERGDFYTVCWEYYSTAAYGSLTSLEGGGFLNCTHPDGTPTTLENYVTWGADCAAFD